MRFEDLPDLDLTEAQMLEALRLAGEFKGSVFEACRHIVALWNQLPEGMKGSTITYSQCERGHGRLMAANWTFGPCPTCLIIEPEKDPPPPAPAISWRSLGATSIAVDHLGYDRVHRVILTFADPEPANDAYNKLSIDS